MKTLTKKELEKQEQLKLSEELKNLLERGNHKVFTSLKHVSQSGMSRRISAYIAIGSGELVNIDWYIERLGLYKRSNKGGLSVSGCGMDMGFSVVYDLSMKLYCPEKYNHDAAYKLKQQWM